MNVTEARAAIEAILAAIDDEAIPDFDRVEVSDDGLPVVWFGGTGMRLGSAKSGQVREPLIYRRRASWDAIRGEAWFRADRRLLAAGDDPSALSPEAAS